MILNSNGDRKHVPDKCILQDGNNKKTEEDSEALRSCMGRQRV